MKQPFASWLHSRKAFLQACIGPHCRRVHRNRPNHSRERFVEYLEALLRVSLRRAENFVNGNRLGYSEVRQGHPRQGTEQMKCCHTWQRTDKFSHLQLNTAMKKKVVSHRCRPSLIEKYNSNKCCSVMEEEKQYAHTFSP